MPAAPAKASCNSVSISLIWPRVNDDIPTGPAASPSAELCSLNDVRAGTSVRIKQLSASAEVSHRLREMGFCEEQRVKLLSRHPNLICQVCNARLGLSSQLAGLILVEPIPPKREAA